MTPKEFMEANEKDRRGPRTEPKVDSMAGSVSDRVAELENAIVNIFRWTGGKRVARECRRVLPDVYERLTEQKKQNATGEPEGASK